MLTLGKSVVVWMGCFQMWSSTSQMEGDVEPWALTSAWFKKKLVYVPSVSSVHLKLYYSFSVPTRHYTFTHNLTTKQQDATLFCQDPFKLLKKLPWMMHWSVLELKAKPPETAVWGVDSGVQWCVRTWPLLASCCCHWALYIWKFCFLEVLGTVSACESSVGIWKFSRPRCCSLKSMFNSRAVFCQRV